MSPPSSRTSPFTFSYPLRNIVQRCGRPIANMCTNAAFKARSRRAYQISVQDSLDWIDVRQGMVAVRLLDICEDRR